MVLNQQKLPELKPYPTQNVNHYSSTLAKQSTEQTGYAKENRQDHPVNRGIEKSLEILLRPEGNLSQAPDELLKENKRKRKKQSRGLHH